MVAAFFVAFQIAVQAALHSGLTLREVKLGNAPVAGFSRVGIPARLKRRGLAGSWEHTNGLWS
ncbi:MAG TPA: hypothetical protein PLN33_04455 [Hyphomonadaceae bacterium]|jgi:hypothetical protein|nr:hypothetical protein [Hyphomonadaceae bacterium]